MHLFNTLNILHIFSDKCLLAAKKCAYHVQNVNRHGAYGIIIITISKSRYFPETELIQLMVRNYFNLVFFWKKTTVYYVKLTIFSKQRRANF